MKDGTTPRTFPFLEGSPTKPDWIRLDPVASGEWDRICGVLEARRGLSPAWQAIISVAASTYATFTSLMTAIETQGQIEGAEDLLSATLATYRSACMDCQVEPRPLATLRVVPFDRDNREGI